MSEVIAPASLLTLELLDEMSDAEILALCYDQSTWMRPSQRIPDYAWRYFGFICGRGFGKTLSISHEINRRVIAREAAHIGLMAPTLDRVDEVQHASLIASAPPWFRPSLTGSSLEWPNGVTSIGFTPEAEGRPRSENLDLSWLTEIVDWRHTSRQDAFDNITTATRVGRRAQVLWDTTSKGRNEVIEHLLELHDRDPYLYPVVRGELFDNPLLGQVYVQAEVSKYSGRRYDEEIRGRVFQGDAAALWDQGWIDDNRVHEAPLDPDLIVIGVDPALSDHSSADEVGIVIGCRDKYGHAYLLEDRSARMTPDMWGEVVVNECVARGAAGVAIERNRLGDNAAFVIRSIARLRGITTRPVERGKPFPRRTPGVIYIREHVASTPKLTRAEGPATATKHGQVHVVGTLGKLENEWTTYAPGVTKSPNRYDASVYALIELLSLNDVHTARERRAAVENSTAVQKEFANRIMSIRGRGNMGL